MYIRIMAHPNPTDFAHEIHIRWMRILAGSVTSLESDDQMSSLQTPVTYYPQVMMLHVVTAQKDNATLQHQYGKQYHN